MNDEQSFSVVGRLKTPTGTLVRSQVDEKTSETVSAGAVVFIVKGPAGFQFPPPPQQPLRLSFHEGKILPSYAVGVVGQEVIVTPNDGKPHNLSCSGPGYLDPSPTFQDPGDPSSRRVFLRPCDFLHLSDTAQVSEEAILTIVPSPLFATPDRDGVYSIRHNFLPGEYTLRALAPGQRAVEKQVTLSPATQTFEVDFQFPK